MYKDFYDCYNPIVKSFIQKGSGGALKYTIFNAF